jgi:hypothetical protein
MTLRSSDSDGGVRESLEMNEDPEKPWRVKRAGSNIKVLQKIDGKRPGS